MHQECAGRAATATEPTMLQVLSHWPVYSVAAEQFNKIIRRYDKQRRLTWSTKKLLWSTKKNGFGRPKKIELVDQNKWIWSTKKQMDLVDQKIVVVDQKKIVGRQKCFAVDQKNMGNSVFVETVNWPVLG